MYACRLCHIMLFSSILGYPCHGMSCYVFVLMYAALGNFYVSVCMYLCSAV